MQSEDYVPGVSGWKLDEKTGELDIGSPRITAGGLPPEPQVITVSAGEWSENDLPANAMERYKFIGDQMMKIPEEFRDSAEFSTEDHSYDHDGSDIRTTLTYVRPETTEEAKARVEHAKVAGTRVIHKNGCMTIIHDGVVRVRLGNLEKPFVVADDQVFISEAAVENGTVTNHNVSAQWSIRMEVRDGQYFAAGIGLGSQFLTSADKFAVKGEQPISPFEQALAEGDAGKILDMITGQISETDLAKGMKEQDEQFANRVRKVIADELRAGGMLHRFNH